jgi:hypothetical protein
MSMRPALVGPERLTDQRRSMIHRMHTWAAGIVVAAALATPAHAGWVLASTDAPLTVVRGTNVTEAAAGDTLREGDLLESREGVAQLQDGHGTLVALGPQTRAMLAGDAHVALLRGWLKIAAASCAAAPCVQARVDTERGAVDIGSNAAAVFTVPETADTFDVFSESGTQSFATRPVAAIPNGHFARIDDHAHLQLLARPPDAFVSAMPVPFRDALQPLGAVKPSRPAQPSRAVTYDDIAPWLNSALPARKTFPARFRSRLADTAFRRDIELHLKTLPDWRILLYPPVRTSVRSVRYL